jgi:GT2 family glycosyltransferase
VTARNAQDERVTDDGRLVWLNGAGRDANSPAGVLYIRDVIVRGPIMWDHQRLEQLGYLCEDFAPIYADDYDLCLRAWRQGYVVGAYRTNYLSPDSWATTRNHSPEKQAVWQWSCNKNEALVMERHRDILNGPKHDQDVAI